MDSITTVNSSNDTNVNATVIQLEVEQPDRIVTADDDETNKTNKYLKLCQSIKTYFQKWTGQHKSNESSVNLFDCIITFIGTFISLGIISAVHYRILAKYDLSFLIGSFGASCVLLFAVPTSPLAQPRNALCGQLIGATVGCVIRVIFSYINEQFIAATLSVAVSILIMQLTNTIHAPGGATALIVIMTKTTFPWNGFQYILMPTLSGTVILLITAVIINNLSPRRHYPVSWW